jgi:hypothetical protein
MTANHLFPGRALLRRVSAGLLAGLCGAANAAPVTDVAHQNPGAPIQLAKTSNSGFWGTAPSTELTYAPESWLGDIAAAGITSVRNFDATTSADHLQPIIKAGMTTTGILWWSAPGKPGSLPVSDLEGWRRYVIDMVTRYKGRIQSWEVWNEPPNFTADRSPASYAVVVAAAYDAAKATDSTVQIGLGAKSNHVNYLAQAIEAGAANKFDFITLHPYENASLLTQGWEGQFMSLAPRVRTMLLDKNPGKADAPIWFTEIGLAVATSSSAGLTPELQADGLVKIYTMAAAQRVARVYWFSPRDAEGEHLGLMTDAGVKRPAYVAMKTLNSYLGDTPNALGWVQSSGANDYGFVFEGPKGTVLSTWARTGKTSTVTTASRVTVVDPRTGTTKKNQMTVILGDAPLILVAAADSAEANAWKAQAATNKGKGFAWYGEHRGATSVSLSATTGPDGVFMLDSPAVKVVDGSPEFDLSGHGAIAFAVDPEFLSYSTRPIRITVTVRGHGTGTGDPGFNLKYESSAPLSATDGNGLTTADGWFRVGMSGVSQKSWTITNPRFVGYFGYNFMLDTDGPSHSQFSLQSIVVTKL